MKRKIMVLLAVTAIATSAACSNDNDKETTTNSQTKSLETTSKQTAKGSTDTPQQTKQEQTQSTTMNEHEKLVQDIFKFHLDHNQFGKYVKSVEQRGSTIIVDFHNSYSELKKSQPFNNRYNEATFPDLYDHYTKDGNYADLNSYLITRTTYVLANYPQIDRIILNMPKNTEGKYYVADVNRKELDVVLGFDTALLKKQKGDTDWGDNFSSHFANEYMYKISDEAYDSNTRFINKFIHFKNVPTKVSGDVVASIHTYKLPLEEQTSMSKLIKDSLSQTPYAEYMTDEFEVKGKDVEASMNNILKEKGDEETKKALVYISGRILADFPELQNVSVTAGTYKVKVNRDKLTSLLGHDIATLVNIEAGEVNDWSAWSAKFSDAYTSGTNLETYMKTFSH
ncbi:hypothetical protein [Bacillus thuringiensis]|uniref:Lipoprotein n=1 Tax=Bacillus thuringiensis TaxID=1428 RepID=A0A9X6WFE4_BACTU|nr:hypothetical protein [Bacillus thuringiensis]PFJ25159.1 hypothetical protein COJ15_35860 [Bacillus thuringiensis]